MPASSPRGGSQGLCFALIKRCTLTCNADFEREFYRASTNSRCPRSSTTICSTRYYICGFLLRRLSQGPPRGSFLDFFKKFTEFHSKHGSTEDLPDTEVAERQLYGGLIFAALPSSISSAGSGTLS